MKNLPTRLLIGILVGIAGVGHGATFFVSGQANLFGAGKQVPPAPGTYGGGVLPPHFAFAPKPDQVLVFTSVDGLIAGALSSFAPPEGVVHAVNALPFDGISGVRSPVAVPFAGVFLGPEEPLDPAPASLDFRDSGIGRSFKELSPLIGQIFIVGDGLTGTGTGSRQVFHVPAAATRLYLGIFDGYHLGDDQPKLPGYYADNSGSFVASLQLFAIPKLTFEPRVTDMVIHWVTELGISYQLQSTDLKGTFAWNPVNGAVVGTGRPSSALISTSDFAEQFYRVIASPAD